MASATSATQKPMDRQVKIKVPLCEFMSDKAKRRITTRRTAFHRRETLLADFQFEVIEFAILDIDRQSGCRW
jgi:hypothetical protein